MKRTSTVFDCWTHLHTVLDAASWSAHPVTGQVPPVLFGDAVEVPNECVIVVGVPLDGPRSEWVSVSGPSQEENYTLEVLVSTGVPGMDQRATLARIKELADLIQSTLRDLTFGAPAGSFQSAVPGVLWHKTEVPRPMVFPLVEGYAALCRVAILFKARI